MSEPDSLHNTSISTLHTALQEQGSGYHAG
jgi:hypothetical protein